MKNIFAHIEISKAPAMYYQMKRDLQNFYKNTLQDKQNFLKEVQISDDKTNQKIKLQGVYFLKTYIIDLWGWSGLQKWYELLTKHKQIYKDIKFFQNIYLDPKLCLRQISDSQGKQLVGQLFWNKKHPTIQIDKEIDSNMKCTMMIVDEIDDSYFIKGKYSQQGLLIQIQWDQNLKEMIKTLSHQLVHFLDQITALNLEQNLQVLKKYINLNERQLQWNQENGQLYTKDDENKQINGQGKQFYPTLNELLLVSPDICLDAGFYFRHYYLEQQQILLYYTYMLQYDLKHKKNILKNNLINKIKKSEFNKTDDLINCFEYLSNLSTHSDYFYKLNSIKQQSVHSFKYIVDQIYKNNKTLYLYDTELSEKVLN